MIHQFMAPNKYNIVIRNSPTPQNKMTNGEIFSMITHSNKEYHLVRNG